MYYLEKKLSACNEKLEITFFKYVKLVILMSVFKNYKGLCILNIMTVNFQEIVCIPT